MFMPVQPEVARRLMQQFPVGRRVQATADGEPIYGTVLKHVQGGHGPIVIRNGRYAPRINALLVRWDDEDMEEQEEEIPFAELDSSTPAIWIVE